MNDTALTLGLNDKIRELEEKLTTATKRADALAGRVHDLELAENLLRAEIAQLKDEAQRSHETAVSRNAKLASLQAANSKLTARLQRVEPAASKALQLSDPEADVEVILGELQDALLDDEIRAALTPPPDARGESPWQPIEMAPKDGTEILGLFGTQVEITSFWPEQTVWCGNLAPRTPTHWQPLPAAPSTFEEEGGGK